MSVRLTYICDRCGKEAGELELFTWIQTKLIGIDDRDYSNYHPIEGTFCSRQCAAEYLLDPKAQPKFVPLTPHGRYEP